MGSLGSFSLQCRRILAGASALFPSNVQAAILNEENSGELGRGKNFTKPVGGRKKNWGGGRGPTPSDIRILAPILPVYNESKMAAKHSKDEKHQNPHQNRLHCRLREFKKTMTITAAGTLAVPVGYNSWFISLPSSAKIKPM